MNIDDAMAAAAEQLEQDTDSADGAEPAAETAPPDAAEAVEVAEPAHSDEPKDTRTAAERARDDAGRFAKEKAAKAKGKPVGAKEPPHGAAAAAPTAQGTPAGAPPPPAPAGEPVAPVVKPPQSWTPAAREAFAKAPPEVQKEVARREAEITRTMQETAQARQIATQVTQKLAPYEALARANGMDSLQYAGSVMQTAAALHMGSPQQKAAVVANIIASYGIDVEAVNAVMQGQAPQGGAPTPAPKPPDVEPLVNQAVQRIVAEAKHAKLVSSIQEFINSRPRFIQYDDAGEPGGPVWDRMKMLAAAQGQSEDPRVRNMDIKGLYDWAIRLDDEASAEIAREKAAQATRTAQPVTHAARIAAGSPKSRPATAPAVQPKGVDAAMRAAAEKLGLG